MAHKIMSDKLMRELWNQISSNEKVCEKVQTQNKNGAIYSSIPVDYDGYDFMLVLNDFDMLSLHFNRTTSDAEVLSEKNTVMSFDPNEHIPAQFIPYARKLMENRCRYLDAISNNWFGGNYQTQCELNYDGCLSYYDLFENFAPGRKVC